MAVLTALFSFSWFVVGMLVQERNAQDLHKRCELLSDVLTLEARAGGESAVLHRLKSDAPMRAQCPAQGLARRQHAAVGRRSPQLAAVIPLAHRPSRSKRPALPAAAAGRLHGGLLARRGHGPALGLAAGAGHAGGRRPGGRWVRAGMCSAS
jgi:hypothetical protein